MCGIFIVLSSSNRVDRAHFNLARDTLIHRGPDASGSVFLQNDHVSTVSY